MMRGCFRCISLLTFLSRLPRKRTWSTSCDRLAREHSSQLAEANRKQENRAGCDLLVEGCDLLDRKSVRDRRQHEHADHRAADAAFTTGQRGAAYRGTRDRGERGRRARGRGAGQELGRNDEATDGGQGAAERVDDLADTVDAN